MKRSSILKIVLGCAITTIATIIVFLWVLMAYGGDVPSSGGRICFDQETASRMVMTLESAQFAAIQLEHCQALADSQASIAEGWKEVSKLYEEKLKAAEAMAKQIQQVADMQSKAYEDALQQARPSIWAEIGKAAAFMGMGVLIGILIL